MVVKRRPLLSWREGLATWIVGGGIKFCPNKTQAPAITAGSQKIDPLKLFVLASNFYVVIIYCSRHVVDSAAHTRERHTPSLLFQHHIQIARK